MPAPASSDLSRLTSSADGGLLHRLPDFWRLQLLGWGSFAVYAFLTRVSIWESYPLAFLMTVALEPLAMVLSSGLRYLYRALGLQGELVGKVIGVIVVSSGLAAAIQLACAHFFQLWLSRNDLQPTSEPSLLARMVFFWLLFLAWSFVYLWLKSEVSERRERHRAETAAMAAQRSELEMLRLQLNPHFLFNSLTNIAAEIRGNPEIAESMTLQLAEYMRYSLEHQDELIVPLADEIDAMKNYLAIEKGRFSNRLQVTIEECEGTHRIMVPCFLLQPLVENAVKHGLTTSSPPWVFGVIIRREEGGLRISVSNSGILSRSWANQRRMGTGLANLRRRLELHYPGRHVFELRQETGLVVAELRLEGEVSRV